MELLSQRLCEAVEEEGIFLDEYIMAKIDELVDAVAARAEHEALCRDEGGEG